MTKVIKVLREIECPYSTKVICHLAVIYAS